MRRILTFLICLAMGAFLFVSCNSALPPDTSDSGNKDGSSSWGQSDSSLGGASSDSTGRDESSQQGGGNSSDSTGKDTTTDTNPKDETENGGWLGKYY